MAQLGSQSDPATDLVPITPDDNNDLTNPGRAIRCRPDGAAGNLRITTADGSQRDTFINAGEQIDVQFTRVHATGTTATNLEAMI
ncbi:MAG: hypothetical protein AAF709_08405 [Pseudomonadota bacterium]